MRIALLVVVVVVAAFDQPARADSGYFGVGFGAARLGGDVDRAFDTDGEIGGRVIGGVRWGDTAIEASFFGTDLHAADGGTSTSHSTLSLGIGVKQYVPLGDLVSIYGRAGVDYTWLVRTSGESPGYSGRGYDLGTGVQLEWHWRRDAAAISEVGVAAWLDAGIQRMRLESPGKRSMDGELTALNLGFTFTFGW